MKKLILLPLMLSLVLSGNLYFSLGTAPEGEFSVPGYTYSCDDCFDGGLSIGYNHQVWNNEAGNFGISVGGSYNILPMEGSGEMDGTDAGFFNVYLLDSYYFSEKAGMWFALGLSMPTHDIDDGDTGSVMGLGFNYKINDAYSIGLGYTVNSFEGDINGIDADFEFTDLKVIVGYSLQPILI